MIEYIGNEGKMMTNNFHTHTFRCLHAYGTEREYALEALCNGMEQLGFSDHAPFPDHDFGYRMPYSELGEYLSAIDRLRPEFDGRVKLFKGLEIEFHQKYIDYYKYLLEELELDYLALGEHMYFGSDGELKNIVLASSSDDCLEYAENVCRAVETGYFRFVAHPDIMFINSFDIDKNIEEACRMITDCAAKNDMILELNANGYRRQRKLYPDGIRYPYPHSFFWKMAAEKNIRVIVGSDCHAPAQLCDDSFVYAIRQAKKFGLEPINSIF